MDGRYEKSSPDFPIIVNFAFSHTIFVLNDLSVSRTTWLSGNFLTISRNIFASSAICPFSTISPSIIVSMPSSISLAINLIFLPVASIKIHSRIDIVVLFGTAFETICTPLNRFDLLHINFIWPWLPFFYKIIHKDNIDSYRKIHFKNVKLKIYL